MLYINIIIFVLLFVIFFFKQKTAYEMRISDWSSDVCSSDLPGRQAVAPSLHGGENGGDAGHALSARCVLAGRAGGDHQPQDDLLLRRLLPAVHRPPDGGRPTARRHVRSEERRVGKECVRTCRSWGSQVH